MKSVEIWAPSILQAFVATVTILQQMKPNAKSYFSVPTYLRGLKHRFETFFFNSGNIQCLQPNFSLVYDQDFFLVVDEFISNCKLSEFWIMFWCRLFTWVKWNSSWSHGLQYYQYRLLSLRLHNFKIFCIYLRFKSFHRLKMVS